MAKNMSPPTDELLETADRDKLLEFVRVNYPDELEEMKSLGTEPLRNQLRLMNTALEGRRTIQ